MSTIKSTSGSQVINSMTEGFGDLFVAMNKGIEEIGQTVEARAEEGVADELFALDPYNASAEDEQMILPVSPDSYEISYSQNNSTENVNSFGEVKLLGKRGLLSTKIESFFPHMAYDFCVSQPTMEPFEYISKLRKWKDKNQLLHFKVGEDVNFLCSIESLTWGENDGTGDVNYTIELKEYRRVGSNRVKPSDKSSSSKGKTYTVKHGDTVGKIAKKYYGSSKYGSTVYKANKSTIEKAWDRHCKRKAQKDAAAWNKKHPSSKRTWKYYYKKRSHKNSCNGKYLVKGTKLTIPAKKK